MHPPREHQSEPSTPAARAPLLWPIDWCHVLAHGISILLLILFRDEAPGAMGWVVWNFIIIAFVCFAAHRFRGASLRAGSVMRIVISAPIIPIYFSELGSLVPYVNPNAWEERLFEFDLWLCGGNNPLELIERGLSTPWLTEVLHWVYDFYYFIVLLLAAAVLKQGRPIVVARMMFAVALCMYLSYLGYYIVPATGPNIDKFALYNFQAPVDGVFLAAELRETLFAIEKVKHNCFPSGHTAVSLLSLMLAWRYARSIVPVMLPLVVALIFSTLYLRYHYVADVLSGIVLAVLTYWLALWLHRRFERNLDLSELNGELRR